MDKQKMLIAAAKSYLLLAKKMKSQYYLLAARNCLDKLYLLKQNELTRTFEFKLAG